MASTSTIKELDRFRILLEDIVKATNNFADENIIGGGELGNVYKGQLPRDGKLINVSARRFNCKYGCHSKKTYCKHGEEKNVEFLNEISTLSRLDRKKAHLVYTISSINYEDHPYIVPMIGYCEEGGEKIIVYPFQVNGSLMMHLSDPASFTWHQRMKLAVQLAKAINHLQRGMMQEIMEENKQQYEIYKQFKQFRFDKLGSVGNVIIHRNINSSTILLDENMCPRLSGFEYSIEQSVARKDHIYLCRPIGTRGYMDPSVLTNKGVNRKSDVYSFGAVLFEILCGRKANQDNKYLDILAKRHFEDGTLQEIILSDLWKQMDPISYKRFSEAAYSCLQTEWALRPDAKQVLDKLEKALRRDPIEHEEISNDVKSALSNYKKGSNNSTKGMPARVLLGGIGLEKFFMNEGLNEESLRTSYGDDSVIAFSKYISEYVGKKRSERPPLSVVFRDLLMLGKIYKDNFRMSFEDIKSATENFNPANVIGGGGFGKVYKGKLADKNGKEGHPIVAKMLDATKGQGDEEFYTELQILCEYKHENIIKLVGYSNETSQKIIVYEHASKGSLDIYLDDDSLTWKNRLKICIDFATGLDFLHKRAHAVIHRDIKSYNILLFDDWKAKIGDFGLSMISSTNNYTIAGVCGTSGYVDPLYLKSSMLTKESDIYSFGVVLFELLCGKKVHEIQRYKNQSLLSFIKQNSKEGKQDNLVFMAINEEIVPNSLTTFLDIVYRCLDEERENRPSSKEVLEHLKKAWDFQEQGVNLRMSLDVIKFATQNFSLANEIERGHFWSVYEGEFANEDSKPVVVKKFDTSTSHGKKHYNNEFQIVFEYKHENIIGLVGYINEMNEKILVYDHASKGSLVKYLSDASLTWTNRLKICIDFAIGLNFLHEGVDGKEVVVHRDIKSSNILLFKNWKAKVGGFGVSCKLSKNNCTMDLASNTSGYVDPLNLEVGTLTKEFDIYSFGVVLFEILCGKMAGEIHKHESESLLNFVKHNFKMGKPDDIVFSGIIEEIAPKSLNVFLYVLYWCLDDDPKKRPLSKEVLQHLREAFNFQKDQDCGCLSSIKWLMNYEV